MARPAMTWRPDVALDLERTSGPELVADSGVLGTLMQQS